MKKIYYIVLSLFILLLCISSVNAGLFDLGDDVDDTGGYDILLIKEITSCYIYTSSGNIYYDYLCEGVLINLPKDLTGYTLKGTFYDGDTIVGEDERDLDYVSYSSENSRPDVLVSLQEQSFINVSNVDITVSNPDGEIVFTQSIPFNMFDVNNQAVNSNETSASLDKDSNNDSSSYQDSSDSSNDEGTSVRYVASVNSDKFHALSCSQAGKIKEGNKITFSSREDAVSAGYVPCGLCKP